MNNISNLGRRIGIIEAAFIRGVRDRVSDDRGEGVISMAIAVLIIATIGAALWVVFDNAATDIGDRVDDAVQEVGN